MSKYALPVGVLAGFIVLLYFLSVGLTRDPGELPSTYIDKQAPEFDLPSLMEEGQRVSNAVFADGPTLVNVWATWCVGCREEHPFLMQLADSNAIPIYGINWRDDRPTALRWLVQYGDPYVDSGFDGDGRVGIDWGVYGAPETFLVDSDGIVLHKHLGPLTASIWERDFVPLIETGGSR
ncbi:MAG: DsbE family thiol:disulfide interchange protein [Woeseiaceae bacterium]|nr:DsbE family thiol:disulfide interchange protein [Woeseiaceae bacterium]